MKRFFLYLLFILLVGISARAQDINGDWLGDFYDEELSGVYPTNLIKLHLEVDKQGKVKGTTYLQYDSGHEYYMMVGWYNDKTKEIYFKEIFKISTKGSLFYRSGNYSMKLRALKGQYIFDGFWKDNNPDDWMSISSSKVFFKKKIPLQVNPPKPQVVKSQPSLRAKPEVKAVQKSSPIEKRIQPLDRKADLQSDILLNLKENDTLIVELMDNGEIDEDRVSIYLDGKPYLRKIFLSNEPVIMRIPFAKGQKKRELLMVAESLGKTPPCTAYMRVVEPGREQAISLSSQLNSNALVRFRLKD